MTTTQFRNPKSAIRNPEVWQIRIRLQENFDRVETVLKKLESNDDAKIQLAAAAELRQHIALAAKTLEIGLRAEAQQAFQQTVIAALAKAGIQVRKQVLTILDKQTATLLPDEPTEID